MFGLGCDPLNAAAVQCLLDIKGRAAAKGLMIAAEPQRLEPFLQPLPAKRREEILTSWSDPVTWVLPARCGGAKKEDGRTGGLHPPWLLWAGEEALHHPAGLFRLMNHRRA